MAIKIGEAMGCHTTVISRGMAKKQSAVDELKAHHYLDSTNSEDMAVRVLRSAPIFQTCINVCYFSESCGILGLHH